MNDNNEVAQPQRKQKFSVSKVWIIPIITLILGLSMAYQQMQQRGTEIEVSFETAEGLVPNKTKLKHRDVDIGTIKKIYFSDDKQHIITKIKVNHGLEDWLREDTLFWVVKPRIGNQGVSGISTLLSGAYIELSPGESLREERYFVGLEQPPITENNEEGIRLSLTSGSDQALSPGEPVVYRGFNAGLVESYDFDAKKRQATYSIFIRKPYDALITTNTYFWNASGFSIETNAKGIKLNMASLEAMVTGGITFDVPSDLGLGERVFDNHIFKLYDSEEAVYENREYEYKEYVLLVEDSVGGLYAGAPVEYRGIRIGTVKIPYLTFSHDSTGDSNVNGKIPVVIRIEPGRIYGNLPGFSLKAFDTAFQEQIKSGLVGSIESGSLLFGGLLVSLDFAGEKIAKIERFGSYTVIPSKPGGLNKFTEKIDRLFTKIDELPLNNTVQSVNSLLKNGEQTIVNVNKAVGELKTILASEEMHGLPKDVQLTLQQLEKTLEGFSPDSTAYLKLEETLSDIDRFLGEFKPLLKTLNNKPNALLFGPTKQADKQPGEHSEKP